MGRPNKAGVCKCGHETRYWHDPETGQCMHGLAWKGHAASPFGGCPCVRKVKGKKMNGTMKTSTTTKTTPIVTVRREVIARALDKIISGFEDLRTEILATGDETSMTSLLDNAPKKSPRTPAAATRAPMVGGRVSVGEVTSSRPAPVETAAPSGVKRVLHDGTLGKAERSILHPIAQRTPQRTSRAQAAILSGYSVTSSSFSNALTELRTLGYITGHGDELVATADGCAVAGAGPLPKGGELFAMWAPKLGLCERKVLETLVASKEAVARDDLAEVSGYSPTSSSFANALSKLRSLKLAHGSKHITASEELF